MRRRDVLLGGAAALSAASLSGCASTTATSLAAAPIPGNGAIQPIGSPLAPIQSSMDRVTRSIVGLRPFRKTGPRLEAATLGGKDIVHNYGHGGGGVSISWGVAEMAASMIKSAGQPEIAVLGSGAIGLSTALELQRAGFEVTIYAAEFPPYTTSNIAGAMWHPVTLFERNLVSSETLSMLHKASRIAFYRFVHYANDPRYGVYWIRQHSLSSTPMSTIYPYMGGDDLYPGLVRNQQGDGPFGVPYWDGYYTLMIDPDIYLRALVNDFMGAGGGMVETSFETEADVTALPQDAIVNCLGLGARGVFGDEDLIPARGQLSFLLPQSDIDYGYAGGFGGHGLLYSFPRKGGIVLGGSVGKGNWDTEVDQSEVERMVKGHAMLATRV
ncbi:MAG: FAD-dependent oxidoreductase [Pseudomonadota bacterium]